MNASSPAPESAKIDALLFAARVVLTDPKTSATLKSVDPMAMAQLADAVDVAVPRHTEPYYARRINDAARRLDAMVGIGPRTYLVLCNHRTHEAKMMLRESAVAATEAATYLAEGRAYRVSVTNPERSVFVFVDPD